MSTKNINFECNLKSFFYEGEIITNFFKAHKMKCKSN
jgi:hypothetical protein